MSEHRFLELLQQKKGFFEVVLELTQEEGNLPIKEWLSVLEQKKILLSCIEEVDEKLEPFQAAYPILPQEIGDELSTIRKVVQEILHIDEKNQEMRKKELRFYA
ncbi:MAG: hypothetical protein K940chlam9_00541 [Chlamydiae bacterium]|nr:hypothetical protein [Chlamydiota bacterium]